MRSFANPCYLMILDSFFVFVFTRIRSSAQYWDQLLSRPSEAHSVVDLLQSISRVGQKHNWDLDRDRFASEIGRGFLQDPVVNRSSISPEICWVC